MATYKVPQNVETEDKLLGPFTLRQLIFVILFVVSGWFAYLLFNALPPLALIMLPFLVFFGVLGFVRRRDQPVEVYLAAALRFYLHPHKRIWDQEGYDQHVVITAPKKVQERRFRDISQEEVHTRLSRLAGIMDTRGWAAKGLKTTPSDRLVSAATQADRDLQIPDVMDEQAEVFKKFDQLIERSQSETKQEALRRMRQRQPEQPQAPPSPQPTQSYAQALPEQPQTPPSRSDLHFRPYPEMHQRVISPADTTQPTQEQPTQADQNQPVTSQPSPDIIRLANNNDLTVSAIAREAHSLPSEEVVISLR